MSWFKRESTRYHLPKAERHALEAADKERRRVERFHRLEAETPEQKFKRAENQRRHQKKAYTRAMNAFCRKYGVGHWRDSALCRRLEKRLA